MSRYLLPLSFKAVILLLIVMVSPRTHLLKIMTPSPEPLNPSSKTQKSFFYFVYGYL